MRFLKVFHEVHNYVCERGKCSRTLGLTDGSKDWNLGSVDCIKTCGWVGDIGLTSSRKLTRNSEQSIDETDSTQLPVSI